MMTSERIHGLPSIGGLNDRKSLLLQAFGQRLAERPLVVDDQDRTSHTQVPSYGLGAAWSASFSIARSSRARVRS